MSTLITVLHIFVALLLVFSIMLQSGRGGGMGAAFGGAGSQVFGGHGAGNFLSKATSIAAIIFFITSLSLSYISSKNESVILKDKQQTQKTKKTKAKKETSPNTPTENPAKNTIPAEPVNQK